jgi:hypothetical protein
VHGVYTIAQLLDLIAITIMRDPLPSVYNRATLPVKTLLVITITVDGHQHRWFEWLEGDGRPKNLGRSIKCAEALGGNT